MLSPTVTYMRMLLIHRASLKKNLATKLRWANGFQERAIVLQRGFSYRGRLVLSFEVNVTVKCTGLSYSKLEVMNFIFFILMHVPCILYYL